MDFISRNKDFFHFLLSRKDEIEKEIGDKIEWVEASVASGTKIKKEVINLFDQNDWRDQFKWLYEKTILLKKVFGKYLKEFKK